MSHEMYVLDSRPQFVFAPQGLPKGPWWQSAAMQPYMVEQPMTMLQAAFDSPVPALRSEYVKLGNVTGYAEDGRSAILPGAVLTARELSDGRLVPMGVVNQRYPLLHPRDTIVPIAGEILGGDDVPGIITMGLLGPDRGERCFLSISLPQIEGMPEMTHRIITLLDGADGQNAFEAFRTSVVAQCANTVRAGRAASKIRLKLKHNGNMQSRLDNVADILLADERARSAQVPILQAACRKSVNTKDLGAFLDAFVPAKDKDDAETKRTRNDAIRDTITELFEGGQVGAKDGRFANLNGYSGDGSHSAYALLMAATEYASHHRRLRGTEDPIETYGSTLWGSGADLVDRAWDALGVVMGGELATVG